MSDFAIFLLFCFLIDLLSKPRDITDSTGGWLLAGIITFINWLFMQW